MTIAALPTAPAGRVATLPHYTPSDFTSSSAILCRNTAPLISFAFALIRRNVGCRVLGREIGRGLVKLVESCRATSVSELEQRLVAQRARETAKAKSDQQRAAIADRFDCLNIFISESRAGSVGALTARISALFDDETRGLLTLATGHKAKGLEWDTVFFLDRKLCPSPWARQPWQLIQERNLGYVMASRARLNLFYIESNKWRNENEQ